MVRQQFDLGAACLRALALTGTILAIHGCSPPSASDETQPASVVPAPVPGDGTITAISQLPFIDATTNAQLLAELLDKPTTLGETTALQVKLPPPRNLDLASSLVRVIGDVTNPHVLFQSDALVQMGLLQKSPGKDFFTAFVTLDPSELDTLKRNQDLISTRAFGPTTNESVLFSGRAAMARTINPPISASAFVPGSIIPVNRCAIRPVSTQQAWDQALFIRSPAVVLDPTRTWDPCTGAGIQGSVWTFAHLIREMANGSGHTPEDFVKDWLSFWLTNYTVNGDVVAARTQMFSQVIQPWANASGVVATLGPGNSLTLSGPLNLNIAPFRLEAIVNRIDLGTTTHGGGSGGYGTVTGSPVTAGELRFIFGVVQPNPWGAPPGNEQTCGRKLFTTIFEYGVPRTGCQAVVSWAQLWSQLMTFPGFTPAYLAQLQSMTESVVVHGAAPTKGNQNAINQIRTNEVALSPSFQWELREFTLTNENPATNTDPPANGELRTHTVALTPNEALISPAGADPAVNFEVNNTVTAGLELPVTLPDHCNASFEVPFFVNNAPFRGGNALSGPPNGTNQWKANMAPATPNGICARHLFSLNTCHGCHRADSGTIGGVSTNFVHADPLSSIPVTLSKFLTGGGPGMVFNVADTQFGGPPGGPPLWPFADLDRRLQRLFDLSHCTSCITIAPMLPTLVDRMQAFGPVPADIDPADRPDLQIGAITDLGTLQKVLDLRSTVADAPRKEPVDVIRAIETASH